MEKDQIDAMERQMLEEHRKDMEALARLKRFLPADGATKGSSATSQVTAVSKPVSPLVPEDDVPLWHAIRDIMNHDPSVRWTNPKMFKYLKDIGFRLNAKKPIYSIGQATQRLINSERIKLLRSGTGSTPNIFRGLTALEQAARESADEIEAE